MPKELTYCYKSSKSQRYYNIFWLDIPKKVIVIEYHGISKWISLNFKRNNCTCYL